jgi:hypothetical protein
MILGHLEPKMGEHEVHVHLDSVKVLLRAERFQ